MAQEALGDAEGAAATYSYSAKVALGRLFGPHSRGVPANEDLQWVRDCEFALQKRPLLLLAKGQPGAAVQLLRNLLEHQVSNSLRLRTLRLLRTVLLVFPAAFTPLEPTSSSPTAFVPQSAEEEVRLAALLEQEMMATAGLPAETKAQYASLYNDLLLASPLPMGQALTESLETGLQVSFGQADAWLRLAQNLFSTGRHAAALRAVTRYLHLEAGDGKAQLLAARLCLALGKAEQACQHAQRAREGSQGIMQARALHVLGLGFAQRSRCERGAAARDSLLNTAISHLESAQQLDPQAADVALHLALALADGRMIDAATVQARRARDLDPESPCALHLMALLLSAQQRYAEALVVCEAAAELSDGALPILLTAVALASVIGGSDAGLVAYQSFLPTMSSAFSEQDGAEDDAGTVVQSKLGGHSAIHSKAGDAASAISTSTFDYSARHLPAYRASPSQVQVQVWVALAELFIASKRFDEAQACVAEAVELHPGSAGVEEARGRLEAARGNATAAGSHFQRSLAADPSNGPALVASAQLLRQQGNSALALTRLRAATEVDPWSAAAWHELGLVLRARHEDDKAAVCLMRAAEIALVEPVRSFGCLSFVTV